MPRWRSGLNVALPNRSSGFNSRRGRLIIIIIILNSYFVFVFVLFYVVLSELDIVKVINCFFSFEVAHFLKKYPTMFIKT